jgi:hypothetical protein
MKKRRKISKDSPWTVAFIIDSTLHKRFSRHTENTQKFNHGKGFVLGHQWTNIGIFVGGQFVPLPPVPFYTKKECQKRDIDYQTEMAKLKNYLRTMPLNDILGNHLHSEIVVLMDSGYDCKNLMKTILSRKWDFIIGIKSDRSISKEKNWTKISAYFQDGRRQWQTIRIVTDGVKRKWQKFATKQLEGNLKGVLKTLKIVCSKRLDGKIKYLACSNLKVDVKVILGGYQKRWAVELFHRAVKSYLGFEDSGAHCFDAIHTHIHWVYCAFLLLHELVEDGKKGIKEKQLILEAKIDSLKMKKILQKTTQISGNQKVKEYCFGVIRRLEEVYSPS